MRVKWAKSNEKQFKSVEIRAVDNKEKYQKILASLEPPFNKTEDAAWRELEPKLSSRPIVVRGSFFSSRQKMAVLAAACVVALLAIFLWPVAEPMREIVAIQQQTVDLPDHSSMILNAESKAKFAEKWDGERVVELDGQAFFQVQKGKRFTVKTAKGIVEVLGKGNCRGTGYIVRCLQ